MKPLRQFKFRADAFYMAYCSRSVGDTYGYGYGYIFLQPFDVIKYRKGKEYKLRQVKWFSKNCIEFGGCSLAGLCKDWEYFEMTESEIINHLILERI